MSVKESMAKYGMLSVRSISIVVDRGSPITKSNYAVVLAEATVNGVKVTDYMLPTEAAK